MEHVSSVRPTGKFPEKVENLKRWSRFPGWNFRTGCRVPFTFLVVCTSSRSTVGHRATYRGTGAYDQMEQLFTNRKFHFCYHRNFRVFFVNGKRPVFWYHASCLRLRNLVCVTCLAWSFFYFLTITLPKLRIQCCSKHGLSIVFLRLFFQGVSSTNVLGAWATASFTPPFRPFWNPPARLRSTHACMLSWHGCWFHRERSQGHFLLRFDCDISLLWRARET